MPLSPNPKSTAGELRADGLVFRVLPDGASVALCGWYGQNLPVNVVVPARVSSGSDLFAVAALEGEGILKDSKAESISLPATVQKIDEGALADCDTLSQVVVSSDNETYSSFDGMLFSKDQSSLLFAPAGKKGAALLPDSTATLAAPAFSRCAGLLRVEVGEGCAAFASQDGILYSKDRKTLVACPPGAGNAVVLPAGVESIGSGSFAGCSVASITVLGTVRDIAADAFDEAAKTATVAIPAGQDHDARKAVWEVAGFSNFSEPAHPGDVSVPDPPADEGAADTPEASGLVYTIVDDYTLSASWAGGDAPAELAIPATAKVGGASYRVSTIAPAGFSGLAGLTSVTLPASLSSIGKAAFAGCSSLTSVHIPDGVTSIGERAFEATALSKVWLPRSVATVGPRAFAACASLSRVVALGSPEVAADALASCSGVSVYCPAGSEGAWNPGIPAAGNIVLPYAASLAAEPLALAAGESANLLEGGELLAPQPVEASYSYSAKPLSVDAEGTVAGKSAGATDVAVTLTLDGVELARASRSVEVAPGEVPEPTMVNQTATLMPAAYFAGARAAAAPINVTAPISVVFGGAGYDVSGAKPTSLTASTEFQNTSSAPAFMTGIVCSDSGADQVLETTASNMPLDSQMLFSLYPGSDATKAIDFGYGQNVSSAAPASEDTFLVNSNSALSCTFRLNLGTAQVKTAAADGGAKVQGLASVTCTFEAVPALGFGTGNEAADFYLKDNTTGRVYNVDEVKAHANAISSGNTAIKAEYEAFMADESKYTCKTTWGGVAYDVRVIGINHDDKTAGGKAGLTFQFKNLLNDTVKMNSEDTNAGGWGASDLRTSMNERTETIASTVPQDLWDAIAQVDKGYTSSSSSIATVAYSSDKLFLASYYEHTGSIYSGWSSYSWLVNEGAQYEFYKTYSIDNNGANDVLVKKTQSSGLTPSWWERSISPSGSNSFLLVVKGGSPAGNNVASGSHGVCPCFCL